MRFKFEFDIYVKPTIQFWLALNIQFWWAMPTLLYLKGDLKALLLISYFNKI
ncbi:hypothetical protein NUACC26_084390 [Scytonema sp. NUACC26]